MKRPLLFILIVIISVHSVAQVFNTIVTVAGSSFGNAGTTLNEFYEPHGVFVDKHDTLYVADTRNDRILKFPPGSTSTTNGKVVAGGNGPGSNSKQLSFPYSLYVDLNGNIYVADFNNHRIQKFPPGSDSTTHGITVAGGNGQGSAANQLFEPSSVYVDSIGNIYVVDGGNERIQKFPVGSSSATNGITIAGGNGGAYHFGYPTCLFMDRNGSVYVADMDANTVRKFPSGSDSSSFGITVAWGQGGGADSNQLSEPWGLFVDSVENIYVSDGYNNCVWRFPAGSDSTTHGVLVAGGNIRPGNLANELYSPMGIYVDDKGAIYNADHFNDRIQKWSQSAAGIPTVSTDEAISLYPNPNTGSFILQSSGSIGSEYTVYDMIGRIVAQGIISSDKQSIALKGISMGSYTMTVMGNKAIRFVIEN